MDKNMESANLAYQDDPEVESPESIPDRYDFWEWAKKITDETTLTFFVLSSFWDTQIGGSKTLQAISRYAMARSKHTGTPAVARALQRLIEITHAQNYAGAFTVESDGNSFRIEPRKKILKQIEKSSSRDDEAWNKAEQKFIERIKRDSKFQKRYEITLEELADVTLYGDLNDQMRIRILRHPLLTTEETYDLITKAQKNDQKAKHRLVQCNMKLIVYVLKKIFISIPIIEISSIYCRKEFLDCRKP